MTENDAQQWLLRNFDVSRETRQRLHSFVSFLQRESADQNLIAHSTLDQIWNRHIADSAQLLKLVPNDLRPDSSWIDLGSGAGFPGIVVALLSDFDVTLVESRTKRTEYLQRAIEFLSLKDRVKLAGMPLERLPTAAYAVISARAFAPLPRLFELAERFSTDKTIWLLPKGRNAAREWEEVQSTWSGNFRIEASITDPESGILVGQLAGMGQKPQ